MARLILCVIAFSLASASSAIACMAAPPPPDTPHRIASTKASSPYIVVGDFVREVQQARNQNSVGYIVIRRAIRGSVGRRVKVDTIAQIGYPCAVFDLFVGGGRNFTFFMRRKPNGSYTVDHFELLREAS